MLLSQERANRASLLWCVAELFDSELLQAGQSCNGLQCSMATCMRALLVGHRRIETSILPMWP